MCPRTLTCVPVFSFVHLPVGSLACDSDDLKFVHAAFSPVDLCFFYLAEPWTAHPGIYKEIFEMAQQVGSGGYTVGGRGRQQR